MICSHVAVSLIPQVIFAWNANQGLRMIVTVENTTGILFRCARTIEGKKHETTSRAPATGLGGERVKTNKIKCINYSCIASTNTNMGGWFQSREQVEACPRFIKRPKDPLTPEHAAIVHILRYLNREYTDARKQKKYWCKKNENIAQYHIGMCVAFGFMRSQICWAWKHRDVLQKEKEQARQP